MKRTDSISWLEILIVDLALILAIGAIGSKHSTRAADDSADNAAVSSVLPTTMLAKG